MNKNNDESKGFAFLGIFLGVVGFLIVLLAKRENKYALFYGKQGLVLTIAAIIISLVGVIPILGWIISVLGGILILILWIMGLIYSLSGEEKDIPIIGEFARKIKL